MRTPFFEIVPIKLDRECVHGPLRVTAKRSTFTIVVNEHSSRRRSEADTFKRSCRSSSAAAYRLTCQNVQLKTF